MPPAISSAASSCAACVAGGVVVVGDEHPGHPVAVEGLGVIGGEPGGAEAAVTWAKPQQ